MFPRTPAEGSQPALADVAQLADVFDLLGDPNRLAILITLLERPRSVGDLAAAVGLSESGTSHALRLLRAHRVVEVRKEGRNAYYELADAHVRAFLELGLEHVEHTDLLHPSPTDQH